jgi:hypothetical protein
LRKDKNVRKHSSDSSERQERKRERKKKYKKHKQRSSSDSPGVGPDIPEGFYEQMQAKENKLKETAAE